MIDGFVHRGDQTLYVGPVEWRDERRAQAEQDLAGDAVGFVLEIEDLLEAGLELIAAGDHSRKATAALTMTTACRSNAGKKTFWRGINRWNHCSIARLYHVNGPMND